MRDLQGAPRRGLFSARTQWDTEETEWAKMLAARRAGGLPIYDLTASNPTRCGFTYGPDLLEALQNPAALQYDPQPFGLLSAREAVCTYYKEHAASLHSGEKVTLSPEHVILTTSTSEAYSFLFRLLCDPGDNVLIAQPSYPLFDFLAVLDDVELVPYPLFYDHGWHIDLHALKQRMTSKTRAIVVVHPNNPTGHFTTASDRAALEALCVECGLALIVDEVFLDYSLVGPSASLVTGEHSALTFVLSGLSKVSGLPQMKLSWIAGSGPEPVLSSALQKLEVIADTFLSVSAPMQLALPAWLAQRHGIQQQIGDRVSANLAFLDGELAHASAVERLQVEAGWYAILRAPSLRSSEDAALRLLEQGVAIHSGDFFGLHGDGYFVLSLLTESSHFREGTRRLLTFLDVL